MPKRIIDFLQMVQISKQNYYFFTRILSVHLYRFFHKTSAVQRSCQHIRFRKKIQNFVLLFNFSDQCFQFLLHSALFFWHLIHTKHISNLSADQIKERQICRVNLCYQNSILHLTWKQTENRCHIILVIFLSAHDSATACIYSRNLRTFILFVGNNLLAHLICCQIHFIRAFPFFVSVMSNWLLKYIKIRRLRIQRIQFYKCAPVHFLFIVHMTQHIFGNQRYEPAFLLKCTEMFFLAFDIVCHNLII